MNQILSMQPDGNNNNINNFNSYNVDNQYRAPKDKANISTIVKVFCVLIIVFSIALIGDSVYGIINSKPKLKDTPNVTTKAIGMEATIKVVTEKPIKQFSYKWGQEDEKIVQGDGTVDMEITIEIPDGNNLLNITVIDYYGNKTDYQKQYINERSDKSKPTIEITVSGNSLNIMADDETELAYLTYGWNEEEVTRIDVDSESQDKTHLQANVEVRKGQNTLTIVAVDKEGNKETKTQTIKGANRPTFDISTEGNKLVVAAKDEEGISRIAITVDGVTTDTGDTPINQKEVTARQEISAGEHTITITVTNMSGLKEEQSFTATL